MKNPALLASALVGALLSLFLLADRSQSQDAKPGSEPLKVLLVAGGCCHDYEGQHKALFEGIQARANVRVDVWWTDDASVDPPLTIYDKADWAEGYDLVIHDECAAGNKDLEVMKRILDVHKTIPAVHLHCAMHSFRNGTDQWFKHLGIQSSRHGPRKPIKIDYVDDQHPITATLEDWTTIDEELYNNVEIYDAHPLAMGYQMVPKDGKEVEETAVVAWTNEKQGARSFSTTIGHVTETVADGRYLDLVTRGLLWAADKLNDETLGKPYTGENTITFVKGKPKEEKTKPSPKKVSLGAPPKEATLVTVTASSEETGKSNFTWLAVDGDKNTRWCAGGSSKPQWIQLAFEKALDVSGATVIWESQGTPYQHKIEGSADGNNWTLLADATGNEEKGDSKHSFDAKGIRFLKLTCTGTTNPGNWASVREIALAGPKITQLFPKLDEKQKAFVAEAEKKAADPHAKEGNITPKIVALSPEKEAEILKDVKVPEGFDVTLFANSAAANYPVYVTAAPNGDLYVSSDGNGSLGRDPHRGRVVRLRDTDGDGKADQVTEFVKDVDSPRGSVWDHDRLILLHPPHITAYIDKDGDGVAEDSQRLISNIAFDFSGRPADHTTNDLEMGIDGWIYIAGGDFGFLKATGTDGRELQHRGGGVIRFRPDGTGLELFATGTRNILAVPTSPLLDQFARDNTNDGGGWDVRFHHFTGLEDHGYPRMYKNFGDEHIQPLADYGGGSGCGGVYIHEPGFPDEWKNAPFTCDWGTGALWKHTVQRAGATFQEITEPQPFIRMTRPTDADVDGNSAVYQASWKGATFKWEGPDVGYLVRVTPAGFQAEPLPDFEKMSDAELVAALESPSHVRTLAAQRTLLRREQNSETDQTMLALAADESTDLGARVAALYAIAQRGTESADADAVLEKLTALPDNGALAPFVFRAMGDLGIDAITAGKSGPVAAEVFEPALQSHDSRTIVEGMVAAARQRAVGTAPAIAAHLGDKDPRIAHTAFRALAQLGASDACFAVIDDSNAPAGQRQGALFALMRMHDPKVVDGLLSRLASEFDAEKRRGLLSALCRLYHHEGEWTGDSWGTRPDTRGPYYQPEPWAETEKIDAALKQQLAKASPEDATFLVREMSRNRIQSNDALDRVLTLAKENPKMIPEAMAQLAAASEPHPEGMPILMKALGWHNDPDPAHHRTLADAVTVASKLNTGDVVIPSIHAITAMQRNLGTLQAAVKKAQEDPDPVKAKSDAKYARQALTDAQKQYETARDAFLSAPWLENQHQLIEDLATRKFENPETFWFNAALLNLASRKGGSPESIEMTGKTLEKGWQNPQQRVLLIRAAAETKNRFLDDRIRIALNDPIKEVAQAAKAAANSLKIQAPGADKTPKIATIDPKKAQEMVVAHQGDVALGEAVFARATCVACHTVSQDEAQKGPYLGNIAETYQRPELVLAILDPNASIAQGFKSVMITLKDGTLGMGFVTDEQGEKVTIRDIASQEHTYQKKDISKREELPTSMMPPGLMANFTVHEMASLVDYLQALAKKKK